MKRREALKLAGATLVGGLAVGTTGVLPAEAATQSFLVFRKQFTVTFPGATNHIHIPDSASNVLVLAAIMSDTSEGIAITLNFIDAFGAAAVAMPPLG